MSPEEEKQLLINLIGAIEDLANCIRGLQETIEEIKNGTPPEPR